MRLYRAYTIIINTSYDTNERRILAILIEVVIKNQFDDNFSELK